tara:strand:- start:378 stop:575 length:198 start_codon:yes stop_codon:yes gene_type:complete
MFSTRFSSPLKPLRTIIMAQELTNTPIIEIKDMMLIILFDFLEKRYLLAIKLDKRTLTSKVGIVY